jgi:tRNA-dihydrouridine synthase
MPWIFRDTHSYLTSGVIPQQPTITEKCDLLRRHFANIAQYRGERIALLEFRKRVSWYAKHMFPCLILKQRMRLVSTPEEFEQILQDFLDWRLKHDEDVAAGRVKPLSEAAPEEVAA